MPTFLQNTLLRLVALLSAILLWFFVVLEKQYETSMTLPIQLMKVPDNIAPAQAYPAEARILVSGSGKDLFLLRFTGANLLINCEGVRRGPNTLTLSSRNTAISVETGVAILLVKDPSEMALEFDAVIQKELPVLPVLNVALSDNVIQVGEPELTPRTALVKGPRVNVARIGHLETQPVQVARLSRDTSFYAFVLRPDYFGVEITPNKVKVSIKVAPILKKTVTDIPIRLIGLPPEVKARLDVGTVSLVVAGDGAEVNALRKEMINVYVSYSRFALEQLVEVEPTVSIVGNVEWSNLSPKTVRLIRE